MNVLIEFVKFIFYSILIVIISKNILVPVLRKFAGSVNLKAKTIGNIAGFATSMPELLSVSFASLTGLVSISIYNILSSNIINFLQYIWSVFINKNQKILNNMALQVDIILVLITIFLPIFLIIFNVQVNLGVVIIFLFLFISFYYINNNVHKLYLKIEDIQNKKNIENEIKWIKGKKKLTAKYLFYIIIIRNSAFYNWKFIKQYTRKISITISNI